MTVDRDANRAAARLVVTVEEAGQHVERSAGGLPSRNGTKTTL